MNKKFISITLLNTFIMYGCGGGSPNTDSNTSNNSNTSTSTNTTSSEAPTSISSASIESVSSSSSSMQPVQSTALISQYFELIHSQQKNLFLDDEESLARALAASGGVRSGAHYAKSQENYQNRIDKFNNAALLYVQQTAQNMEINKVDIIALLNIYKANDKAYANTYYSGVQWGLSGSALTTFIESVQSGVEDSYSLTALAIQII